MKIAYKFAAIPAAAALGLGLAACDTETPAEEEIEQQADAIEESYDAEADLTEALAAGGPNEDAAEERADHLRQEGEDVSEHLEDLADELEEDDIPR